MKILWLGLEHELGIEKDHQVMIMNKDNYNRGKVYDFQPDIVIEREFNDGKHIWTEELMFIKNTFPSCKIAMWFIDTHVAYNRHKEYMHLFNYCFFAISKYATEFKKFWLPVGFPLATIPKYDVEKKYLIGFIGRWIGYPDRIKLLSKLKERYRDLCHFETNYETVYKQMSKCNIMVNYSFVDDMNYRVFEALGMGNILVTNIVPDICKIDDLHKRMCLFKTIDGAVELVDDLLKNKNDIDIKDNIKFIEEKHTLKNRIESMLKMIDSGLQVNF